uniref:TSA: Wollemia nobilis Ref_Wollemi_Transcript_22396_924 transcribed RNA sequence n=1 Tax=Wollemia nobilis TaxID=56998 RepID=A0A0C9QMD9_9CONI
MLITPTSSPLHICSRKPTPKMAFICSPNPLIPASKSTSPSLFLSTRAELPKSRAEIRRLPTSISYKLSTVSRTRRNRNAIMCEVALEETEQSVEDVQRKAKVGDRVKVRGPLKVYHVPKTPEFDLGGMEGEVKNYVGVWKGKRISANLPYKVQFNLEGGGRAVKFFAHLHEDEFDVVS